MPLQSQELLTLMTEAFYAAQKRELAADVLRNCGSLRLRAMGTSMLPAIWPGDVLVIESTHVESVHTGDVVLISRGGEFVIHRLIGKRVRENEVEVLTRGDGMAQADPISAADQLLGRVNRISRGHLAFPIQGNQSLLAQLCAYLLRESDLLRNLALRFRASQQARFELACEPRSAPAVAAKLK